MGLPLSAAPPSTKIAQSRGQESDRSSLPTASSRAFREGVTTQHGMYSLNVVVTDQQSCMAQSSSHNGSSAAALDTESRRPTVLLLHGFLGCTADWDHIAASLALTCRCISIDLPGHGATQVNAEGMTIFSIQQHAMFLAHIDLLVRSHLLVQSSSILTLCRFVSFIMTYHLQ